MCDAANSRSTITFPAWYLCNSGSHSPIIFEIYLADDQFGVPLFTGEQRAIDYIESMDEHRNEFKPQAIATAAELTHYLLYCVQNGARHVALDPKEQSAHFYEISLLLRAMID